jgi:hypothetical protein
MNYDISILLCHVSISRREKGRGNRALYILPNGRTVLEYQLSTLRSVFPSGEIITALGFEAEKVLKSIPHGVKTVEDPNFLDNSVGKSVSLGMRVASTDKLLIIYGDLIFNSVCLGEFKKESCILVNHDNSIESDKVGVSIHRGRVTNFAYGISPKFAQMTYLTGDELKLTRDILLDRRFYKYNLHEILNRVLKLGGKLKYVEPEGAAITEISEHRQLCNTKGIL